MEQEIQSKLFRLSILVATSLATLSEKTGPNIIHDSTSQSTSKPANELTLQILNDVKTLFTSVQKSCTNLTLALKPNSKLDEKLYSEKRSPIAGLDEASLTAAKAQIISLMDNDIPKLVFLVQKAKSEATVSHYVPKTEEDLVKEKEEKELVRSRGGQFIVPSHARDNEKLEKIRGKGLGESWARTIESSVFGLLDSIGDLSKTYMDEKTLRVMQKASAAREKREGIVSNPMQNVAKDAKTARQLALQSTATVWNVCDAILQGERKLPENNREAVQRSWNRQTELIKDALRELKEGLEGEGEGESEVDEDDPIAGLEALGMTEKKRSRAKQYIPFIESCCQLHVRAGKLIFTSSTSNEVDFDDIKQAGESISDSVDDLVASLLYGGEEEEEEDLKELDIDGKIDLEDDYDVDGAKEDTIGALEDLYDAVAYDKSAVKEIEEELKHIKELSKSLT